MNSKPETPIPAEFCNSETGAPFSECLMCHQSLQSSQYIVEKAFKNYPSLGKREIIFEYAMCLECAAKMNMKLSDESRSRIEAYMITHLKKRGGPKNGNSPRDINDSVSHCAVNETAVSDSAEYSIYALCDGPAIVLGELPYALSGEVQDEIMQLLSVKTLDILDDFIGNHFSGPPEVREILRRRPILI